MKKSTPMAAKRSAPKKAATPAPRKTMSAAPKTAAKKASGTEAVEGFRRGGFSSVGSHASGRYSQSRNVTPAPRTIGAPPTSMGPQNHPLMQQRMRQGTYTPYMSYIERTRRRADGGMISSSAKKGGKK